MKTLPLLLLGLSALAHADEARTCTVDGWLKMRPAPNAAGDIYGEPDWPEKIHLYPASGSRSILDTLPFLHFALVGDDEARTCTVDGWLKMRLAPNPDGDSYGRSIWLEKIPLYPASGSREPLATLPDAMQGGTWDYLSVSLLGRAQNSRFPVQITARGATSDSIMPVSGWLYAGHIGFTLQSGRLYTAPDAKSAVKLAIDDRLSERGDIILRDCVDEWVQIDYRQRECRNADGSIMKIPENERHTLEGVWARGVCPTLETACDMPDADKKP